MRQRYVLTEQQQRPHNSAGAARPANNNNHLGGSRAPHTHTHTLPANLNHVTLGRTAALITPGQQLLPASIKC